MGGFVSFVGAGPWDAELITLAGVERLRRAEVVIADYLVNPNLLLHAPAQAEVIQRVRGSFTAKTEALRLRQPELNALMVERAHAGKYVVRLKGGDPCMFGRGAEEASVLREAGIDYEFVPGVSSPIAAPESAGIPVTHRDHTPAVTFVSGFEAYEKAGLAVAWEHLAKSAGTLVLMMSVKNARDNARRLVEAGRDPDTPAAVVRWGTRGTQQTVTGTLTTIADRLEAAGLRAPSVLVVGHVVSLREQLAWVEQRPLFGTRIVVTRSREQGRDLAMELGRRGADVALFPCLEVVPPEDLGALDEATKAVGDHDGVILSSPNGVDAFFSSLRRVAADVRSLHGTRVVAIGASSAEACRRHGIEPDLVPTKPRSEGLIEALRERDWLDGRWLHVRAEAGRDVLGDAIEAAGGTYRLVAGYRTVRPAVPPMVVRSLLPPTEGGEGFDAVVFASGRTAEHFMATCAEQLGEERTQALLGSARIVSIGPVTTKALQAMGLTVAATAQQPDEAGLVAAVESLFVPS
jgi:uroporphyrinogen III methyltransferase/synthase